MDSIVRLIVGGQLQAEQVLPSVRQMAEHLSVNPMTVPELYSNWLNKADYNEDEGKRLGLLTVKLIQTAQVLS